MAVTDAYATAADYRARVGKSDVSEDGVILAQLTAISRYIDGKTQRYYGQDTTVTTVVYDTDGRETLRLHDDIATTTGLIVKADLDGDYDWDEPDETLTINTHFWLDDADAPYGSEVRPYTRVRLIPDNGRLTTFPTQYRSVSITATRGWPAVPAAIKEATVALTRQLRDIQHSGLTLTLENLDAQIRVTPEASRIVEDLVRVYARTNRVGWFA